MNFVDEILIIEQNLFFLWLNKLIIAQSFFMEVLLELGDFVAKGIKHISSSIEPEYVCILFDDSVELHIHKIFLSFHFIDVVIDLLATEDVVDSDFLFLNDVDTVEDAVDLVVALR